MNNKFKMRLGQLLVEVIISVGLIAILVAAVVPLVLSSASATQSQSKGMVAAMLAKEQIEAANILKLEDWNQIYFPLNTSNKGAANPYHLIEGAGKWQMVSGEETVTLNDTTYTRSIIIENVLRDGTNGAGNIVSATGWDDPSTQKVTAIVKGFGGSPVTISEYFTRWQSQNLTQTDWPAGQFGAVNNVDTTTQPGSLQLAKTGVPQNGSYGNHFLVTSTGLIGRLNASNRRLSIRFTAQKSGTLNQLNLYLANLNNSSATYYRYGIQADNSGLPSGTYLSSSDQALTGTVGWRAITIPNLNLTEGTVYHIVVQYSSGTTPSSTRYIDVRNTLIANLILPLAQTADLNQNTLLYNGTSWAVQNAQPVYVLGFSDSTYEGNSYDNFAARSIYGVNFEGEVFTPSADTVVSSLRLYLSKSASTNPADDLHLTLKDLTTNSDLISNIVFTNGAVLSTTYNWITYNFPSNITFTVGHQYRLFLSSPSSVSSRAYRIYSGSSPAMANMQALTWDGINSAVSRSTNSGTAWTQTNYVDWLGYDFTTVVSSQVFASNGDLISNTYSLAKKVGLNRIYWNNLSLPANTTIGFQLATNNDNATWNFLGPDGTGATYYTFNLGENIFSNLSNSRYLRYKVYLKTADTNVSPALSDVRINYSP